MNDDAAAFTLAWTVTPHDGTHPTPRTGSPVPVVAAARRDAWGTPTTWPTCSRGGDTTALSQVIDPIDPLDPTFDTIHLLTQARRMEHNAHVLARAVLCPSPDRCGNNCPACHWS